RFKYLLSPAVKYAKRKKLNASQNRYKQLILLVAIRRKSVWYKYIKVGLYPDLFYNGIFTTVITLSNQHHRVIAGNFKQMGRVLLPDFNNYFISTRLSSVVARITKVPAVFIGPFRFVDKKHLVFMLHSFFGPIGKIG